MKRIISSVISILITITFTAFYFREPFDFNYPIVYLLIAFAFALVAAVSITTLFYDSILWC